MTISGKLCETAKLCTASEDDDNEATDTESEASAEDDVSSLETLAAHEMGMQVSGYLQLPGCFHVLWKVESSVLGLW